MEDIEDKKAQGDLYFAILVTIAVMIIQIIGFYLSNSLALLSDTVHILSDLIAMAVGFIAIRIASRKATQKRTFGFHRVEVFSAMFNGTLLFVLTILLAYEAVGRFFTPHEITPLPLLFAAFVGLAGNVLVAFRLQKNEDMNMHSVFLHVAGDALSSIGVLVGAVLIIVTGIYEIDSLITLLIAVIISISAYRLIREGMSILFESVPDGVTPEKIARMIKSTKGVISIHDVHVWSICSDIRYATAHVVVKDRKISKNKEISEKIRKILEKELKITHATLQFETMECYGGLCKTWHESGHIH